MVNFGKQTYPTQEPAQLGGYGREQPPPAPYGSEQPLPAATYGSEQPPPALYGSAGMQGMQPARPRFSEINANWAWVVVAVIFFWPLGFAAASAAGRVVPAMLDGDYGRAYEQSRNARLLGIIALCLGIGATLLVVAVFVVAGANGAFDCQPDGTNC